MPDLSNPADAGSVDLAPIGNCGVAALIDRQGRYVWACAPRFDSAPVFSRLLSGAPQTDVATPGQWSIELEDLVETRQAYLRNSAVLRTEMVDARGAVLEIIDFCPRFRSEGRTYRPAAYVRIVRPLKGAPRIAVRLTPVDGWSGGAAPLTHGSNHIRYQCADIALRLTTSCPVSHVLTGRTFRLEESLSFFLGADEPFSGDVTLTTAAMLDRTLHDWREWVRTLSLPLEWQTAVIRAAITLKLCQYEETGAIVAALTTSIPEAPHSGRNWDYRYCWIRDAYYVVRALNRLGAADLLENYLGYLRNLIDQSAGGHIQPVYGVGLEPMLTEMIVDLPGYRGMGPVRVGNQAYEHLQHDVYGQIVLPLVQGFYDERLLRRSDRADFDALEKVGERAFAVYDTPDAGLWEFRTKARIHTYSAVMCWAACDRVASAARALGLDDKVAFWTDRAQTIRARIDADAWSTAEGRFAGSFGGTELDASLLQLVELGYLSVDDPRQDATFAAIERDLLKGTNLFRYVEADDFGEPSTAFNFCTFWYIEALNLLGRNDEARRLFEQMLSRRTHAGLLSEDIALEDGELWGNYPQTYSLVGMINCAVRLSHPWSAVR